jgi:hypothetical protein
MLDLLRSSEVCNERDRVISPTSYHCPVSGSFLMNPPFGLFDRTAVNTEVTMADFSSFDVAAE